MSEPRVRVLLAKCGLDGHDRGVKIVARALRDAGMEVIYTGLHQTPEQVVSAAIQEDADVIGLSILSGAHLTIYPRILELLKAQRADDIQVVGGGTMLPEDISALKVMGVAELFVPDTSLDTIVQYFKEHASRHQEARAAEGRQPHP
jgi:methylmalonyl-CoA mutase cobalamin-binding domain/chain